HTRCYCDWSSDVCSSDLAQHIAVWLLLLLAALVFFAVKFFRAPGRSPFRAWGWAGLAIIGLSESLLFLRVELVGMYFTPLVWTRSEERRVGRAGSGRQRG